MDNPQMDNPHVEKQQIYPKTDISEDSNNPKTYIKPSATKKRKEAKPQRTFSEIRRLIAEKDAETNAEKEKENERAKLRHEWAILIAENPALEQNVKIWAKKIAFEQKPELSAQFRKPLEIALENKMRRRILDGEDPSIVLYGSENG